MACKHWFLIPSTYLFSWRCLFNPLGNGWDSQSHVHSIRTSKSKHA